MIVRRSRVDDLHRDVARSPGCRSRPSRSTDKSVVPSEKADTAGASSTRTSPLQTSEPSRGTSNGVADASLASSVIGEPGPENRRRRVTDGDHDDVRAREARRRVGELEPDRVLAQGKLDAHR